MKNRVLETLGLQLCTALFHQLPRPVALSLGTGLGQLASRLGGKPIETARSNLTHAFPELSEQQRELILRSSLRHLGMTAAELLHLEKSLQQGADFLRFQGLENLRQAQEKGQGVVLFSGHLGFWEGASVLGQHGFEINLIAKPMHNPAADLIINRLRTLAGAKVIQSMGGGRKIMQVLRKGGTVALLLDQHYTDSDKVRVPFFGRPAWTSSAVVRMAIKTGAALIPCQSVRQPDRSYDTDIGEPLELPAEATDQNVLETCTRIAATLETMIRRHPEQWFWVHRRWRD